MEFADVELIRLSLDREQQRVVSGKTENLLLNCVTLRLSRNALLLVISWLVIMQFLPQFYVCIWEIV
jgi:hypothetical protein